jgi:phytoene dehydrogenase-like protein
MKEAKIYIIGAGVSGLVAAIELEKAGFSPIILEGSDSIGGRVKTDELDGFRLDQGFQILLTAYPEAIRYLDYQALNLKYFDPGAVIFDGQESFSITDPLRNPLKVFEMIFSKVGTLLDKLKMFSLTQSLKKKTVEKIFASDSKPTLQYLKDYGFSDQIISYFFRPFFRGIFLEPHLNTSSRMFEFVFKMFSMGDAAVPAKGMGEIPKMLRQKLSHTQIYFDKKVKAVHQGSIELVNGESLETDRIIIATQPDQVMEQLQGQFAKPKFVTNCYFTTHKSFMARPMIGLIPEEGKLINNMVFMTDVSNEYAAEDRALLSVTILEHSLSETELIKAVRAELASISGINGDYFKYLKTYEIPYALPTLEDMRYSVAFTETKITDHVFLAGDYLLNGSINAAMTSGRLAAEAVIHSYMPTY